MITIKVEKDWNIIKEFTAKNNMPLLDQLEENWISMASSCRSWSCGICWCMVKQWEKLIDKQAFWKTLVWSSWQNVLTCLAWIKEWTEWEIVIEPMF